MSEQKNNTPNLRFPEFTGEWEEKTLGEVAKKVNRKNTLLKVSRVLTNSANLGVVDQGAYFDRDIAVKENTGNYSIVEIEDFVYNPRISTAAPVGPISINKVGQGIMSPLYTVFKFHTGCISFYEQYFQTTIWHDYLKGIANFGARFDRMNITTEGFFNMPLYLPIDPTEQEKIASCLSAMDELIAAQAEKVDALKEKKTGMMQQLFPRKGETTPRLRFPEFTGEWVEKNINDCFEFKQGVQCPVDLQALQKRDGYIRFIRIIDLTQSGEPPRYIADPGLAHHICKEDLFMVRYGSPGLVGYGYEGIIANNLFRLLPKFDMCTKFFKDILTALHKNIAALCGIGALPAINFSTLGLLRISLPPTIAEQQKIADCLSALDDQIAAETEKLTALKDYKKGLMQQLFPQPAK